VAAIHRYAETHDIPVVHFKKGQSKEEIARPYLRAAAAKGAPGVAMLGIAQEKASAWRSWRRKGTEHWRRPQQEWGRQMVMINHFYLSVGGPPVKGGMVCLPRLHGRAGIEPGSCWSALSKARTNELDAGEERRRLNSREGRLQLFVGHLPRDRGRNCRVAAGAPRLISVHEGESSGHMMIDGVTPTGRGCGRSFF
jgi:hypothetical protein